MSVIHEEQNSSIELRLLVFPVVLLIALGAFLFRLWVLQVVQSDSLIEAAQRLRATKVIKQAPRGLIEDRNGMALAKVKSQTVIMAVPRLMYKKPEMLDRLAAILGTPVEELQKELAEGNFRPAVPTPVFNNASVAQATKVAEDASLEGITVSQQPIRIYPDTKTYAHVLGYVRAPSADDVKRLKKEGIEAAAYVGKQGLELKREAELMGIAGFEELEMDRSNRPLRTLDVQNPQPGNRLILGIDDGLQKLAVKELQGKAGSVVAIEPKTGEILAMVSYPSFDAAMFQKGVTQAQLKALYADTNAPMVNRAVATPTAPGSTFKIMTTIGAMKAGVWSPSWSAYCSGGTKVGNRFIRCTGNHGSVSFSRAMQKSCNAYFIRLAIRTKMARLGATAHECGLGVKLGVDTTGERAGLIPDEKYMEALKAKGPGWGWFDGHTANAGIGQGEVNVTPLQMASFMAMVANEGVMYRPRFVRATSDAAGTTRVLPPEKIHEIKLPEGYWPTLKRALVSVLEPGGTAYRLGHISGLHWGGKTGSAERRSSDPRKRKTDSWFVGFAPLEDPKIAICVRLEFAGHGGEAAAPFAAKMVQKYLKIGPYAPKPANVSAASSAAAARASSPNLR